MRDPVFVPPGGDEPTASPGWPAHSLDEVAALGTLTSRVAASWRPRSPPGPTCWCRAGPAARQAQLV